MVTAVVLLVYALIAHGEAITRKQYCGDRLTSKLFSLCGGMYNKRFGPPETGVFVSGTDSEDLLRNYILDLDMMFERSLRDGLERPRRGIVEECCRRGCTIRELSAYCLDRRK